MSETTEKIDLTKVSASDLAKALKERKASEEKKAAVQKAELKTDEIDFLESTTSKFISLHHELKGLKNFTITEANKLHHRMFAIQGKEPKKVKTFSIKTGDYKVTVDMQDKFEFTPEATVHIQTIQQIFKDKFADRNKAFYKFLEQVLMRNSQGEFDPKLLAKGRQQVNEIGDPILSEEFKKLELCQRVVGTATYCRVYKKVDNKWKDINIQFSSL